MTSALTPSFRQRGVSLIEMMVSMAIGLVLVATIGNAYIAAKQGFGSLDAQSRVQDGARYAFEFMGNEVRMAGFTGGPVGTTSTVNVVIDPGAGTWDPNLKNLFGQPLMGYEDTASPAVYPTGITPLRGDVLTVVHADNETEYALSAHAEPSITLTFTACPTTNSPQAGEVFVLADYTHAAVFQIKEATSCAANAMDLDHGMSTVTPGNNSASLGTFGGPIEARKLYRLKGVSFYIAANPAGEPSLYRQRLSHTGTTANAVAEELVEGVDDMQIQYGVDTDATADRTVNEYCLADEITAGTCNTVDIPGATAAEDWARVLSVRVTLTLVSRADRSVTTTGDGLLRKTITNTLAVRNRL